MICAPQAAALTALRRPTHTTFTALIHSSSNLKFADRHAKANSRGFVRAQCLGVWAAVASPVAGLARRRYRSRRGSPGHAPSRRGASDQDHPRHQEVGRPHREAQGRPSSGRRVVNVVALKINSTSTIAAPGAQPRSRGRSGPTTTEASSSAAAAAHRCPGATRGCARRAGRACQGRARFRGGEDAAQPTPADCRRRAPRPAARRPPRACRARRRRRRRRRRCASPREAAAHYAHVAAEQMAVLAVISSGVGIGRFCLRPPPTLSPPAAALRGPRRCGGATSRRQRSDARARDGVWLQQHELQPDRCRCCPRRRCPLADLSADGANDMYADGFSRAISPAPISIRNLVDDGEAINRCSRVGIGTRRVLRNRSRPPTPTPRRRRRSRSPHARGSDDARRRRARAAHAMAWGRAARTTTRSTSTASPSPLMPSSPISAPTA